MACPAWSEKKFPFDQCEYKANNEGQLNIHNNSLHMDMKYTCNLCGYQYQLEVV